MMGVVKDVMKILYVLKKIQVDEMVDIPPFVNIDMDLDLEGLVPNPTNWV